MKTDYKLFSHFSNKYIFWLQTIAANLSIVYFKYFEYTRSPLFVFSFFPSINPYTSDGTKRLTSDIAAVQHLTFTSDPSTLKVNGVVVGVTSTDALMHLTKSEVSVGSVGGADRMTRLVQHIIHQRWWVNSCVTMFVQKKILCFMYGGFENFCK